VSAVAFPRAFVGLQTDHGFMIVNRNDFHAHPSGITYGVGHQLLSAGSYEREEVNFVLDVLRNRRRSNGNGVVALDCGANIGVHTLEMGREMFGWGQVLAFEPQERLFYALCGNIVLNNLSNVKALNVALGETAGHISIPRPDYNRPASFGSLELTNTGAREYIGQTISYIKKDLASVAIDRIDNLRLTRVDFIKIDVEGMELEVLRGAENTLQTCVPDLLVEWIKCDKDALITFLSNLNYNSISEIGANLYATKTSENHE
jgi:FkbM family methyltransferase